MTLTSSAGNNDLPIYESLVRERGDVVTEARVVAEQTQAEASQALTGQSTVPRESRPQ